MNLSNWPYVLVGIWAWIILVATPAHSQEVIVLGGLEEAMEWLQAENWWGEENRDAQLQVPCAIITGITQRWRKTSQALPVPQKKEIFYRFMLPLIVHANRMVRERRAIVEGMRTTLTAGDPVSAEDLGWLREAAVLLRIRDRDGAERLGESSQELGEVIDEALYKLDVIPAGLALGLDRDTRAQLHDRFSDVPHVLETGQRLTKARAADHNVGLDHQRPHC